MCLVCHSTLCLLQRKMCVHWFVECTVNVAWRIETMVGHIVDVCFSLQIGLVEFSENLTIYFSLRFPKPGGQTIYMSCQATSIPIHQNEIFCNFENWSHHYYNRFSLIDKATTRNKMTMLLT